MITVICNVLLKVHNLSKNVFVKFFLFLKLFNMHFAK